MAMTDLPNELTIQVTKAEATPSEDTRTALDFETFYVASRDRVYRAVLVATRHQQTAEDATHEAYERAFARWDVLGRGPEPVAWVIRVALNQSTSWWRRRRREMPEPPEHASDVSRDPPDEALIRIIWGLPRRQRQVIALRILADQSIETTAAVMGISEGTVKSTLHRALASVRETLTQQTGDDQ